MKILENKVLIKLFSPELDTSFDIFIPVNESIYKIKKLIVKYFEDFTNTALNNKSYILINKLNSRIYKNNEIVRNTDIRNSSELLFVSIN